MFKWISRTIAAIASFLNQFQVKQVLAVALVGFLLITSNVRPEVGNKNLENKVLDRVHQDRDQRPKTTGEWLKEAEDIDSPGERVKAITEESGEAFKDFGKVYPKTAKRSARDLQDSDQ